MRTFIGLSVATILSVLYGYMAGHLVNFSIETQHLKPLAFSDQMFLLLHFQICNHVSNFSLILRKHGLC